MLAIAIVALSLSLSPLALAGPIIPVSSTAPAVCTSTATITDYGFTGSWAPTMTETTFLTTVTSTSSLDCGACEVLAQTTVRSPHWGGLGPVVESIVTVTAAGATTEVESVCAAPTGIIH